MNTLIGSMCEKASGCYVSEESGPNATLFNTLPYSIRGPFREADRIGSYLLFVS